MRQGESVPPFVIWMANFRDRCEHAVTIEQAEATAQAGTGIYESLCETRFLPDCLTARPGPRCLKCERRYQRWIGARPPAQAAAVVAVAGSARRCPVTAAARPPVYPDGLWFSDPAAVRALARGQSVRQATVAASRHVPTEGLCVECGRTRATWWLCLASDAAALTLGRAHLTERRASGTRFGR